jgi:hypothetical protein
MGVDSRLYHLNSENWTDNAQASEVLDLTSVDRFY